METAYIRIKFAPLIKNIVNTDAHYELEIVPITSCLDNIDKIEWKHVKDKIEYTVPITYKIVIKKQNSRGKRIKMYYSCVDIVSSMPLVNLVLSGGDVLKSMSDFSISRKENEAMEPKTTSTFDGNLKSEINYIDFHFYKTRDKSDPLKILNSELTPLQRENVNILQENVHNEVSHNDLNYSADTNLFDYNILTLKNTDCNTKKVLTNETKHLETLRHDIGMKNKSKIETKKNIISTPAYSINTEDNILTTNLLSYFANPLMLHNKDDYKIKNRNNKNINFKVDYSNIARILPEVRVANFLRNMEREIRPLKIILNDIINKCISSNLYALLKNKPISRPATNVHVKCCDVRKDFKSNRVVYSLVFHE